MTMAQEKKKFTIPKRVPSRELLQQCKHDSREYAIVASEVERSLWNSKCGLKLMRIEIVNNELLSRQFNRRKVELQKETSKRQDVIYGFKMFEDYQKVKSVCKLGLTTCHPDFSNVTCLGDPKFGVYLSRCADVLTRNPPKPDLHSMMVVFQVIKGRFKSVAEQHGDGDLMEPTPFHEGHVSKEFRQNDPSSMKNTSGYSKLFDSCQIYLYEMNTELDDLYEKRPRHCNPYAVVFFEFECQRPQTSGETTIYKVQPKIPNVKNLEKLISPSNKSFKDPSDDLGASTYFTSQLERAVTVWHGKLCNKTTSLTDVIIKCHTSEFPRIFPILGDYLSFRTKTDIVRLKDFLPNGLYSASPFYSRKPLVFYKNEEYLHCEMYPRNQHSTAFARLRRSLKISSQALMLKLPFNTYLYILPTCDITNALGITFDGYPEVLHLLFIRKVSGSSGAAHRKDDFLLDARSILKSKTLELEKLKLATPYGLPNPVQTIDINSKSPFHDETEWVPYPVYFSDTEKQSISTRIQIVRQAVVKEMIMSGNKKYKHTYKTPYFIHEYGSNSGRRRSSRGLSKNAKRPGGKSTSLPLDKEQLQSSEISDRTTRMNVEGKDASYTASRDPRLGRKRTGDFSASSSSISKESKDLQSNSSMMKASVLDRIDEGSHTFATATTLSGVDIRRLSSESVLPSSHRNGNFSYRNATRTTEDSAPVDFPGFEKQRSKEYGIALKPAGSFHDSHNSSSRSVPQDPRLRGNTKEYLLRHQNDAVDFVQGGHLPSCTSAATNMSGVNHSTSAGRYDLRRKHSEAIESQNSNSLHVSLAGASRDGFRTQVTRREEIGKTDVNYKTTSGNTQVVTNKNLPSNSYALSEKWILNEAVKRKKDFEGQFSVVSTCESKVSKHGSLSSGNSTSIISLPAVLAKLVTPSSYSRKSTGFQPAAEERLFSSGDSVCNSSVTTVATSPANFDAKSTVTVKSTSAIKSKPLSSIPSCTGISTFATVKLANFNAKSTVTVKTTSAIKNTPLSSIPSCSEDSAFVTAKLGNFDAKSTVTVKTACTIKNTPPNSIPSCTGSSTFVTAKVANLDAQSAVTVQAASTVKSTNAIMNTPLSNIPSCTGSGTFVAAKLATVDPQSAVTVQTTTTVKSTPLNNTTSFIASNDQAFITKLAVLAEPAQSANGQSQCTLSSAEKVAPKSVSSSSSVRATETTHSVSKSSDKYSIVSSSEAKAKLDDTSESLANSSAEQATSVSVIVNSVLHSHRAKQIDTLPIQTQPPTDRVFQPSSTKATLSSQTLEGETPGTANATDNVSMPIPEKATAPKSSSHSSTKEPVSSAPIKSSVSEKTVVHAQTPVEKSDSQNSSAVWQRAKAKQQHAANLINSAAFSVLAHQQALMQQRHAYHQLIQNQLNIINPHVRQPSVPRMVLPQLNVQQNVAFQRFPAQPLTPHSMQRFVPNLPGALRHENAQVPLSPFPASSLVGKDSANMEQCEARELDPRHTDLPLYPSGLNDVESCKKLEYSRGAEQNFGLSNAVSKAMELQSQSNNSHETINPEMIAFDDTGVNASANINVLESVDTENTPVDNDSLIRKVVNGKYSLPHRRSSEEQLESELQTERLGHRQAVDERGGTASEFAINRRNCETYIERDTGSQRDISDSFLYNHRSHTQTDERYANSCAPGTHMTSDEAYNTGSYDASYQAFVKAANDVEQIKKVIDGLEEVPRMYSLRSRPFANKAQRSARNVASKMDRRHSNSSSERKDGFNLSLSWSEEEDEELEAHSASSSKAHSSFLHESDYLSMGNKMADGGRSSRRLENANIDDIDASSNRQLHWSSSPNVDTQSALEDSRVDVYSGLHDLERDDVNEYEDISREREIDLRRCCGIALNNKLAADAMENILGSRGSNKLNQTPFSELYEEKERSRVEPGDFDSSIDFERHSCFWQKKMATEEYDRVDRYTVFQRRRESEKSNHSSEHGIHLERGIEHLTHDDPEETLDSRKENRRVVISPSPMIESDPVWEELDNKYDEYCIRNDFSSTSKLLQIKSKHLKDLASSKSKANNSLDLYVNENDEEFQLSKRAIGKRPAMFVEGTSNEHLQSEENDSENMPLKRLAMVSDLQKTQDDNVKPSRMKKQVRRVKVMSEENTTSAMKEPSEEDWVTIFKNEKEEGEISTQGEDNNEATCENNVGSKNLDLRTVLNKMRGRKSDKAGSSQVDAYSSDNAQSHRDIEPKRVRRKVSVVGKKSRQRIVTKVQKETSDHETSSKRRVETSKRKNLESDSSDAKLKLAKHELQKKRLYSRSDRSRKRKKSDEKSEDRRRSLSSSSSSSEGTCRRDESSRAQVRKRQRHTKNRIVLESMPESHHGKAHPLQHNAMNAVKSMEYLVPNVSGSAKTGRTEDVGSKTAEKHEQISDGNKNIVDKERKREKQVGSPVNWYDVEEFTKFDVSNDGVDRVSSIPNRENGADDNLKEPTPVSSAQHHIPSDMMTQGGNEVMVSQMYDEVYSNISPVSDAEDTGISGGQSETYYDYEVSQLSTTRQLSSSISGYRLRDLVDVPEAVIRSINELDKHVVEEYKHLDDEEVKEVEAALEEPEKLSGKTFDRLLTKESKELGKVDLKEAEAFRVEPEKLPGKTFDRHLTEESKELGKEDLKESKVVRVEPEKLPGKTFDRHLTEESKELGKEDLKEAEAVRVEPEKLPGKTFNRHLTEESKELGKEDLKEAEALRVEPEKLPGKTFDRHLTEESKELGKEDLKESKAVRVEPEKLPGKTFDKHLTEESKELGKEDLKESKAVRVEPEKLPGKTFDKHLTEESKELGKEDLIEAEAVKVEPAKLPGEAFDRHLTEEIKQLESEELKEVDADQTEPEKLTEKTLSRHVVEKYTQLSNEEFEKAEAAQTKPEKVNEKTLDKRVVEEYKQLSKEDSKETDTARVEPEKLAENTHDKSVVEEFKQLDTEEWAEAKVAQAELEQIVEESLDNADPALINTQYARVSPVDDRTDREKADMSSISNTPTTPARDTSNIMWKLMSDSQSAAKVLLKNQPNPRFKEHPLLFNLERESSSHYISMQGGFVPGAAQDKRRFPNFKAALELNIQELPDNRKTEENVVDSAIQPAKDSTSKDATSCIAKLETEEGQYSGVSSDSSSPDHESLPVEMELVTDEEEAQVLYIEETIPIKVVPKSEVLSVNSIDNILNSELSDKEVLSMEMSSSDESGDSPEALEIAVNDAGETATVESKQGGEDERQPGQEGSTSSKNHSSDLEMSRRKDKPYHDYYHHHYHPRKRFGESRKSYRLGKFKADGLKQEPIGKNMEGKSSKDFFDRNSSPKLFNYEQLIDGFSEETKRFLKVDCQRDDELSLHDGDKAQPTSEDAEFKKTELHLDSNTDEYQRKLNVSPISSRKLVTDRHLKAHRREPLYGDRAPTIDAASATRTHKALSDRWNLVDPDGDTDFLNEMTGRHFQSQSPEPLPHFKDQKRPPFSSSMLEKDSLAHYNRYHWKSKHSFSVDQNPISKKLPPKGGSIQKFQVDNQPKASEVSTSSPVSVLDHPEHQMLNCDESYNKGPEPVGSTPKYRHDFRRSSRYNAGSLDDMRPPRFHGRHWDLDASEDSRYPVWHSAKKSYPIWHSARKSNHLSDDNSQSMHDLYDARRVYEESDGPVGYYVKKPHVMYDKNTMIKFLDRRKESFSYANERLTMLHMMGNSRKYRRSSLQDRGWPGRSGLNGEEEYIPQAHLYLDPDDRELKQSYPSPLLLREIALSQDHDLDDNDYYDYEESRRTRRDFMERHVSEGTVRQSGVRLRDVSPSHLYNVSKNAVFHARTEDDIIFARKRGHFAPRPIDFDAFEGDVTFPLGKESESDEDMEDRYFAEFHDGLRPFDLIHMKRKIMQSADYNEDSYRSNDRPFFGEVLDDEAHSHNRPFVRDRFSFRGTGRRFSQMQPR